MFGKKLVRRSKGDFPIETLGGKLLWMHAFKWTVYSRAHNARWCRGRTIEVVIWLNKVIQTTLTDCTEQWSVLSKNLEHYSIWDTLWNTVMNLVVPIGKTHFKLLCNMLNFMWVCDVDNGYEGSYSKWIRIYHRSSDNPKITPCSVARNPMRDISTKYYCTHTCKEGSSHCSCHFWNGVWFNFAPSSLITVPWSPDLFFLHALGV